MRRDRATSGNGNERWWPIKGEQPFGDALQAVRVDGELAALLGLAGIPRAGRRIWRVLFERHADPGQRKCDQEVANRDQNCGHRRTLNAAYVRLTVPSGKRRRADFG